MNIRGLSVCRINCEYDIGQDNILFQTMVSAIDYAKQMLESLGIDYESAAAEDLITFDWVTIK